MPTVLVASLAIFLSPSLPSAAAEWPRFRGPNGGGQAEAANIPSQWTDRDYLWRAELPGVGQSSPVVFADRVIVTSANPQTATLQVLCFHVRTGARLWAAEVPSAPHHLHARNSFATSTPAVDERCAYVTWASPERYAAAALELASGRVSWQADLGPFRSQHGFGASPIVYDNLLIVPNDQDGDSSVVALAVATGKPVWKTARRGGRTSYGAPCVYQPAGRPAELILTSSDNGMSGLDPHSGRLLWSLDVFPLRTVNSPVVAGDLVLASCGQGSAGKSLVAVRPGTANEPPRLVYEISDGAPYVTTPVVHGDLLFIWHDRGTASCHELATGKRLWNKRLGGNFSGSPVCVGERLFGVAESGEVIVLAAGREYKLLGRTPLGQTSRATPAVAGGRMFLRTESRLFCLGGAAQGPTAER